MINNILENTRVKKNRLENPLAHIFLVLISMIYMALMLASAILTNRYIGTNTFFVLGGTLVSPLFFVLDDIVAEIYGFRITQYMIMSGFCAQTLFILICIAVVNSPHPDFFKANVNYIFILGPSLLKIDMSGFIAYIIANLVNSYILTRWKVLLKGRKFWLRSLGSSTFSEALYTALAIFMMELNSISSHSILKVILISFLIKIFYSALLAGPANIFVNYIKKITGIDVYDFPRKFTSYEYFQLNGKKYD